MKEVMVVTDTLSSITPELAEEHDVMVVPYHLIMDGKDYLDNTTDREELFSRLKSFKNLPTHSACTQGEILKAFKKASKKAKSIIFIAMSSTMSADYDAALQAKEIAKEELPGIPIWVIDSRSVCGGELLAVLAAARAANEGKSLSDVTEIARRLVPWATFINIPETLFFFERSGRSGGEPTLAKAPVPIYPLLEMDASSGGAGKFIIKNRTKAKAIEALLKLVEEKSEGKKLQAIINYTDNPEEAEKLKEKLLSRFEVSEVLITPWSIVASVVGGPGTVSLAFHSKG